MKNFIYRNSLVVFFLISVVLNCLFWFLNKRIDTGIINGFAAIAATSPAIAAAIVLQIGSVKRSFFRFSKYQLKIFGISFIGIILIFFFRRYWVFQNNIQIPGRPITDSVYPHIGALITDLFAAIVIGFTISKTKFVYNYKSLTNKWFWVLISVSIYPVVVFLGNILSHYLFLESIPIKVSVSWSVLIVDITAVFLYTLFCGGGMEEAGWRGFLLVYFEKKFNPLISSLLVAPIWGFWHLPLFLTGDYKGGIIGVIAFMLGTIPMSIILTMVFNLSKGYLLAPMLLHTVFNITSTYLEISPLSSLLWLLLSGVFAVLMLIFSSRKKVNLLNNLGSPLNN